MSKTLNMVGGGGGMFASIFAIGAAQTDTVTVTTPSGEVKSGVWVTVNDVDGFLFEKLREYGNYTLTATNARETVTQTVTVDIYALYRIEISYTPYLYYLGDECEDITGGFVSGLFITDYGTTKLGTAVKGETSLRIYGSDLTSMGFFTNNLIDTSGYAKLVIEASAVSASSGNGTAAIGYNSSVRQLGNKLRDAITVGTNRYNITDIRGNYYIGFGGWGYHYDCTVTKIWLER